MWVTRLEDKGYLRLYFRNDARKEKALSYLVQSIGDKLPSIWKEFRTKKEALRFYNSIKETV